MEFTCLLTRGTRLLSTNTHLLHLVPELVQLRKRQLAKIYYALVYTHVKNSALFRMHFLLVIRKLQFITEGVTYTAWDRFNYSYPSVINGRSFQKYQKPFSMNQTSLSDIWEDLHYGIRHTFSRQNMTKARRIELHTYPANLSSFVDQMYFYLDIQKTCV